MFSTGEVDFSVVAKLGKLNAPDGSSWEPGEAGLLKLRGNYSRTWGIISLKTGGSISILAIRDETYDQLSWFGHFGLFGLVSMETLPGLYVETGMGANLDVHFGDEWKYYLVKDGIYGELNIQMSAGAVYYFSSNYVRAFWIGTLDYLPDSYLNGIFRFELAENIFGIDMLLFGRINATVEFKNALAYNSIKTTCAYSWQAIANYRAKLGYEYQVSTTEFYPDQHVLSAGGAVEYGKYEVFATCQYTTDEWSEDKTMVKIGVSIK
jgi:hypothetical protein